MEIKGRTQEQRSAATRQALITAARRLWAERGYADVGTPEMYKQLDDVKWAMLEEWSQTKQAPQHAAWMHEREFNPATAA